MMSGEGHPKFKSMATCAANGVWKKANCEARNQSTNYIVEVPVLVRACELVQHCQGLCQTFFVAPLVVPKCGKLRTQIEKKAVKNQHLKPRRAVLLVCVYELKSCPVSPGDCCCPSHLGVSQSGSQRGTQLAESHAAYAFKWRQQELGFEA